MTLPHWDQKYIVIYQTTTIKTKKPYARSKNKIKVELDLANYETKSDLKNATGANTSKFFKKDDLASLKSEFSNSDIDKEAESNVNKL